MTTNGNGPAALALDLALAYHRGDLDGFCATANPAIGEWIATAMGLAAMLVEHLAMAMGREHTGEYLQHLRNGGGERVPIVPRESDSPKMRRVR
jgi:hypothetical protein